MSGKDNENNKTATFKYNVWLGREGPNKNLGESTWLSVTGDRYVLKGIAEQYVLLLWHEDGSYVGFSESTRLDLLDVILAVSTKRRNFNGRTIWPDNKVPR